MKVWMLYYKDKEKDMRKEENCNTHPLLSLNLHPPYLLLTTFPLALHPPPPQMSKMAIAFIAEILIMRRRTAPCTSALLVKICLQAISSIFVLKPNVVSAMNGTFQQMLYAYHKLTTPLVGSLVPAQYPLFLTSSMTFCGLP